MKIALIGTGVIILAGAFALILKQLNLANQTTLFIVLGIVIVGFIMQMIGLFSMKPPRFF